MYSLLYIEDQMDLHSLVKETFIDICEVSVASTIAQANKILRSKKIDFIIADVELPDGNSIEYFEELVTDYELPPIIFLSGHDTVKNKIKGLMIGATDFVAKPADLKALRARIQMLINNLNVND